jgi:hypothetical protein
MRDLRDLGNIQHFETGIADGFADHQAGIGLRWQRETLPARAASQRLW